jgi:hypothetical protein
MLAAKLNPENKKYRINLQLLRQQQTAVKMRQSNRSHQKNSN